jgi:hypothetical protein
MANVVIVPAFQIIMRKAITVQLDDRKIEIKKLPIGRYVELLKALETLPKQISGLDGLSNEDVLSRIPLVIAESLPEFIDIMTIATELKREEIEELGLDECIKIVEAVFEVNNFKDVFSSIKKVLARPETAAKQTLTQSSGQ